MAAMSGDSASSRRPRRRRRSFKWALAEVKPHAAVHAAERLEQPAIADRGVSLRAVGERLRDATVGEQHRLLEPLVELRQVDSDLPRRLGQLQLLRDSACESRGVRQGSPRPSGVGGIAAPAIVYVIGIVYDKGVKLTLQTQLLPERDHAAKLKATVERFNEAANWAAGIAFEHQCSNKIDLQKIVYRDLREQFGLSSQMAVRCIAQVCEAYKRDKSIQPTFRKHAAVPYDLRLMSFKGPDRVSLLTLEGRVLVAIIMGKYQAERTPTPRDKPIWSCPRTASGSCS